MKPGWLAQEPDARAVRTGWLAWSTWGVIGGALLFEDWKLSASAFNLVLTAPFWALWLLWPLLRLAYRIKHWGWIEPRAAWHGAHYEFDGRRMRVRFVDEEALVAAADVFDALGTPAESRRPERIRIVAGPEALASIAGESSEFFTAAGLAAWLGRRSDAQAHALARWFEHEVVAPARRRREAGLPEARP
ncbi:MAG TPA: hypothetical protein PLN55_07125 [Burkholderiaceae bacterium]|nr:hypothetical protein [Burkholderiaceae bacterium]